MGSFFSSLYSYSWLSALSSSSLIGLTSFLAALVIGRGSVRVVEEWFSSEIYSSMTISFLEEKSGFWGSALSSSSV